MDRRVNVVYCDDIRNEVGNKKTHVGIYQAELVVPSFPTMLPQLCLVISVQTPSDKKLEELNIKLLSDADVLLEVPVDSEQLLAAQPNLSPSEDSDEKRGFAAFFEFKLAPFLVERPSTLRVRVMADGEELRGQSLRMRLMQASDAHIPVALPVS